MLTSGEDPARPQAAAVRQRAAIEASHGSVRCVTERGAGPEVGMAGFYDTNAIGCARGHHPPCAPVNGEHQLDSGQ